MPGVQYAPGERRATTGNTPGLSAASDRGALVALEEGERLRGCSGADGVKRAVKVCLRHRARLEAFLQGRESCLAAKSSQLRARKAVRAHGQHVQVDPAEGHPLRVDGKDLPPGGLVW
eukprot:CAMPEP_0181236700 /NCGR_PEP_ID=MMETSP1096-20121128/38332_1 /TAXON_ID=156174 ORGANISM="Chrysochromulina ericina, Strain CCMP281" /NCGR_SAMPLE_ID=MMETSP1096 /ASSEMBLY_ACC=CAM_ASM_000453 /LENGTH=117 /DNA_ID=CAMNT_0023331931 /DNA_START=92 /DNA_END=445 /DNA_ORIENTATION=-